MEMTRENPHEFPAAQVLMDLAANRPLRTRNGKDDGNLHVCFDKKLKQNALNNFLISHTPYRCSLGRPKETSDTKQIARQPNRDRMTQNASSELSLPKIPPVSESLIGRNFTPEDSQGQPNIKRLIGLESEEEEEPRNFLSCKSVKENQSHTASRTTIDYGKESRSRSLPLILKKGNCSSCLKADDISDKSLDKVQNGQNYSSTKIVNVRGNQENNSLRDQEFTTVMEDGAKVTVYQHRLFIEVFMPRTW